MDMLKVGNIIGSYRDIRLLGAGGMGAVYEVAPLSGGKSSALKKLKKSCNLFVSYSYLSCGEIYYECRIS